MIFQSENDFFFSQSQNETQDIPKSDEAGVLRSNNKVNSLSYKEN